MAERDLAAADLDIYDDSALRRYVQSVADRVAKQSLLPHPPRVVIADRDETSVITSIMSEDDVRTALKHPLVGVGTDSGAQAEDGKLSESKSHPRAWGSFPRILGQYVRDDQLLSLEEAVRKMTAKAAARVHLTDRGLLRPGMKADMTIFDPATIRDLSTFEDPKHYASGVRHVIVNGRRVLADGALTSERPGRPLRGPGARATRSAAYAADQPSRRAPR
jgi:N-acyl-D-aspartate/D-glutamate deacylase